ncbi:type VII secretion protein EccB [Kitasatospora sp. NPDC049285]|uniref:type VII secretion protein EccB n=1 Tax=Kitasatospora sp. NPDC049285 TaxID=3157096 RepID=UPI00343B0752
MASRRDELNAYTFARKRMVGAFLQPSGGGNDEDAPRPVRAVLPSFVVAAVLVAGFGMWGVLKPSAPPGWDSGKAILQGKTSTTRYVMLKDEKGVGYLHQVLNMSSARLVLQADAPVQIVADDVLDKYPHHGATIGIPYAPDRLPKPDDAGKAKLWSVCDKLGEGNTQANVSQSVFIAADDEAKTLTQADRLVGDGQSLFVQGPQEAGHPGSVYLVDGQGRKHAVGRLDTSERERAALETALFKQDSKPQQVTKEWLDTLADGEPIGFPDIPDFKSTQVVKSSVDLSQDAEEKVGRLLKFQDSYYVVGLNKLFQITPFQAELIRLDPAEAVAYNQAVPVYAEMSPADNNRLQSKIEKSMMDVDKKLPQVASPAVNIGDKARTVICSTFNGYDDHGNIKRSVWAHTEYPAQVNPGASTAHVTAGHGLLFRAMEGDTLTPDAAASSGSDFLITDAGLRYSLPANADGGNGQTASQAPADPQGGDKKSANESQARLGYKSVTAVQVSKKWTDLVPAGPVLNTNTAVQAQNA